MREKEYNGWTNYETWLVALWLGNDSDIYRDMVDLAKRNEGQAVYKLGDKICDYVKKLEPIDEAITSPSFVADLVNSALSEVDWNEIAQNYLDEVN